MIQILSKVKNCIHDLTLGAMDIRNPPYMVTFTESRDGQWSFITADGTQGGGWYATIDLAVEASKLARGQRA